MNNKKPKSVLFVCLGNICRSPTGEGVLQHLVAERGVEDQIEIDSAGTAGYHIGKPADARMRETAERRGYQLLSRSRKLGSNDLEQFDLILAMDRENLADTLRLNESPTAEVRLFSDFLGDDWPSDVPDPYYGGQEGFEYVVDMVEAGCAAVLDYLLSEAE